MQKKQSLKIRLIVIIGLLNILAVSLTAFITAKSYFALLDKQIAATLKTKAELVSSEVISIIDSEFNAMHNLAILPNITDTSIPLEEKCKFLSSLRRDDRNIAYYDAEGNFINAAGKPVKADVNNSMYLQMALKQGRDYYSDPQFSKIGNRILMFLSTPVKDSNGKVIGCIVSAMDGTAITTIANSIDIIEGYHPLIVNYSTNTVVTSLSEEIAEDEEMSAKYSECMLNLSAIEEVNTYKDPLTGSKMISASHKANNGKWIILCNVPYNYFYGTAIKLRMNVLLLGFIACIIICVILWLVISRELKPLVELKDSILNISTGEADLTKRIEVSVNNEIGEVIFGFNEFSNKMHSIISELKKSKDLLSDSGHKLKLSSEYTASSINDIIDNINGVHSQIIRSSDCVSSTVNVVNSIENKINNFEKIIDTQSDSVNSASAAIEEMLANIESITQTMDKMANSFEGLYGMVISGTASQKAVFEKIEKIEEQSVALEEANKVIAGIASQTNLLAMNAAIEAAHAGDAGRGFAVVADEIRKLSENSTTQSKNIKQNLSEVRKSITEAASESETNNVMFSQISDLIKGTKDLVADMKEAMAEQSKGSQQINDSLQLMKGNTSNVIAASTEISRMNESINSQVSALNSITSEIKSNMNEMTVGASKITDTGTELENVANSMSEAIIGIADQVDKFKV